MAFCQLNDLYHLCFALPPFMMTLSLYWSSYALGARASTESHRSANPSILLRKHNFATFQIFERKSQRKIEESNQTINRLPVEAHYALYYILCTFYCFSFLSFAWFSLIFIVFFFFSPIIIQMPIRIELFTIPNSILYFSWNCAKL